MRKRLGVLAICLALIFTAGLVYAGTFYFPIWEMAPSAGITTNIFVTSKTGGSVTVTYTGVDGTVITSSSTTLSANGMVLFSGSDILTSTVLSDNASHLGSYTSAGYYLGAGYITAPDDAVIFVDVLFTATNSGFSVPAEMK